MSQWPKWLRRQYGKLEICGPSPGYDTNFSLKNYHLENFQTSMNIGWSGQQLFPETVAVRLPGVINPADDCLLRLGTIADVT